MCSFERKSLLWKTVDSKFKPGVLFDKILNILVVKIKQNFNLVQNHTLFLILMN